MIQILPVNLPWDVNCWRSRSCQCGWTLPSFAYPPNDCLPFPLWPAQVWWQPKAAIKIMGSPKNPSLDNLLLYQITKQVVDHNLFWSYHRSRFEPFFLLSFCCDWGMHAVLENCIIRLEKMMNFENHLNWFINSVFSSEILYNVSFFISICFISFLFHVFSFICSNSYKIYILFYYKFLFTSFSISISPNTFYNFFSHSLFFFFIYYITSNCTFSSY